MTAAYSFLSGFHIGTVSGWDIFIALILLIIVLVYGLFLGRNRMIIILLSSYFSFLIVQNIPWWKLSSIGWLGVEQNPSSSLRIILFLGIILLFYFLIPRSALTSVLRVRKRGLASWWQLFFLSIVQIGFLAMIILSFLPLEVLSSLAPTIRKLFIGPEAQFVWITLPILTIILMRKKKDLDKKSR
ncbi:hypothetical protein KKH07_00010 [Patescibacteria group bacterium]|nr:hypothetical protein [Patescibacteria group bacterium]MBU1563821.1 hypothetical protein [Patescibacteria group bacterium]MBU2068235.1 hypothetical protein [Patescibacteria group bacterium]